MQSRQVDQSVLYLCETDVTAPLRPGAFGPGAIGLPERLKTNEAGSML